MPTVKDILDRKPRDVAKIDVSATVHDAAALMNQRKIGALVVTRGDNVVGIFTERDVLMRVVACRADPDTTRVEEVMTSPVACCRTTTSIEECRSVMTSKRIRHLPVVRGGLIVSMLSIRDLMRVDMERMDEEIKFLHAYLYQVPPKGSSERSS